MIVSSSANDPEKGTNLHENNGKAVKGNLITDPQDPYFDGNHPQNHSIDLLEGFFMLEEDLNSDSEDELEDEECEDESTDEPMTNTDIVAFTQKLAEAQLAAVKAECIAMAEKPNWKCHYTGNSKRTKWYHAQK
ncbi:hypothetical protein BU17DRAFT_92771 [Hysterangium stoloniferum]|nr:hypothetical protein BU17DRAFT_92771 [Hysterangium stoloniferum]